MCVYLFIIQNNYTQYTHLLCEKKLILDEMNVLLYSRALCDSNQQCLKELRDTDHMLSKSTL